MYYARTLPGAAVNNSDGTTSSVAVYVDAYGAYTHRRRRRLLRARRRDPLPARARPVRPGVPRGLADHRRPVPRVLLRDGLRPALGHQHLRRRPDDVGRDGPDAQGHLGHPRRPRRRRPRHLPRPIRRLRLPPGARPAGHGGRPGPVVGDLPPAGRRAGRVRRRPRQPELPPGVVLVHRRRRDVARLRQLRGRRRPSAPPPCGSTPPPVPLLPRPLAPGDGRPSSRPSATTAGSRCACPCTTTTPCPPPSSKTAATTSTPPASPPRPSTSSTRPCARAASNPDQLQAYDTDDGVRYAGTWVRPAAPLLDLGFQVAP
jgi:hypothetical protein